MTAHYPTQIPGDKLKKALTLFSELLEQNPQHSRKQLLQRVEMQFDLSPAECEFLHKHFSKAEEQSSNTEE